MQTVNAYSHRMRCNYRRGIVLSGFSFAVVNASKDVGGLFHTVISSFQHPLPSNLRFLWSLIFSVDCSSRRCPFQYTEEINIRRFEGSGCRNVETSVSTKAGGTTYSTLEEFREMYEAVLDSLTAISNYEGNKWRFKTLTDVFGLLCGISSSAFTAAFQVDRCMLEYTVGLSKLLQGSTQDIIWAYKEVALVWTSFSTSDKLQMRSRVRSTRRSRVRSTRRSRVRSTRRSTVRSTRRSTVRSTRRSRVRSTRRSRVRYTRRLQRQPNSVA